MARIRANNASGGGGGITAYTVEGTTAYTTGDVEISTTSASTSYVIKTGLSEIKKFRWVGKATNGNSYQLIDYDTDRTGGYQHVILIYNGTQSQGSYVYSAANGAENTYRAAITSISGGNITIKTSSNATYGAVTMKWQAG